MILTCGQCARDMEVAPAALGRNIQCPHCQCTFLAKLPAATIVDEDGMEGVILTGEAIDETAGAGAPVQSAPPAARPDEPATPPAQPVPSAAAPSAPPTPVALPVAPGAQRAPEQKVACRCPKCGKLYRVSRSCLGMSAKCACGKPFVLTYHASPGGAAHPQQGAATPAPHAPQAMHAAAPQMPARAESGRPDAPAAQDVNIPAELRKPTARRLPQAPPNATRNKVIIACIAVAAIVIISILLMLLVNFGEGGGGKPTRENFDQIKTGMSVEQVEELLGKRNDQIQYFASVEKGFFVGCDSALVWGSSDFAEHYKAMARGEKPSAEGLGKGVIVTFANGKMKDKAQEGL